MKLNCKACMYVWEYKGLADYWTSCPKCKANVKVMKDGSKPI